MLKRIALLTIAALLALISYFVIRAQNIEFRTPEELADDNGAFIDIDGAQIYYVHAGTPDNPAVILVHGFGGSTFSWRYTVPALAEAGFYAVALDLPPFGLSDKNPEIDMSRSGMADLIAGFMDGLNIERAAIVGHSMGGSVTAQFGVRHPERVQRLVFVAGGVFEALSATGENGTERGRSPLAILNAIDPKSPVATALLRTVITPDFFANTIRDAYYDKSLVTEDVASGYSRLLLIEDAPAGFLAYVQAVEMSSLSLDDLAAASNNPALIIWGEEDTWVSIALGEMMRDALPDAQMITYPQVGHLPMEETPDQFNADLIAFLQS